MVFREDRRSSMAVIVAVASLAVAIMAVVLALTRSSTTRVVTAPTNTTTLAACVSSARDAADFVTQVHSQGHAAYESRPVNVSGNGSYTLLFGPLSRTDAARFRDPHSIGLSFPITNRKFSPNADRARISKVTVNGAAYGRVPIAVIDFTAPCAPLRGWLQY